MLNIVLYRGWASNTNTGANTNYFLYANKFYYTLSPCMYNNKGYAWVFDVNTLAFIDDPGGDDPNGGVQFLDYVIYF